MNEKDKRDYYICLAIFLISLLFTFILPNSGLQAFLIIVDLFLFNVLLPFTVMMIKDRKNNKDFVKVVEKQIKKDMKNPDFIQDTINKNQGKRDYLYNLQRPNDDDYGYVLENPIMESTIDSSYRYLDRLYTPDGKKLTYKRVGAWSIDFYFDESTMVDRYELLLDGKEYKTIFICPYGHSGNFVPKGLKLVEEQKENKE